MKYRWTKDERRATSESGAKRSLPGGDERRTKTIAIVAGAGSGRRLGTSSKKPFVMLGSRPIIAYCLETLAASSLIDAIIVAVEGSCLEKFKTLALRRGLKKIRYVVPGGETRFESIRNCLAMVDDSCDIVLIHDAARPFLEERFIKESIRAARLFGGALVAVPEKDTVKRAGKDMFATGTLERSGIWRAQTPQTFRRSVIMEACGRHPKDISKITDDAYLVEAIGRPVKIVPGSYDNIKITTPDDLALAKVLLKKRAA